jgi:hypothetical protein
MRPLRNGQHLTRDKARIETSQKKGQERMALSMAFYKIFETAVSIAW